MKTAPQPPTNCRDLAQSLLGQELQQRTPEHLSRHPHDIRLPDALRDRAPGQYAAFWRYAGQSFPRDLKALTLLAAGGWSSRFSLNRWLVEHDPRLTSLNTGAILRLWKRLEQRGLVEQRTVRINRRPAVSVALVWLSDMGHLFLRDMGVPAPVVCEWDRLRLGHNGPAQPSHTAMVIITAHFMRTHGYRTLFCPLVSGRFRPDLELVHAQSGQRFFLEVEAPSHGGRVHADRLLRKWQQLAQHQDFAALCALTPRQRLNKAASAQQVFAQGVATDTVTLHRAPDALWPTTWGGANSAGPEGTMPLGQIDLARPQMMSLVQGHSGPQPERTAPSGSQQIGGNHYATDAPHRRSSTRRSTQIHLIEGV